MSIEIGVGELTLTILCVDGSYDGPAVTRRRYWSDMTRVRSMSVDLLLLRL